MLDYSKHFGIQDFSANITRASDIPYTDAIPINNAQPAPTVYQEQQNWQTSPPSNPGRTEGVVHETRLNYNQNTYQGYQAFSSYDNVSTTAYDHAPVYATKPAPQMAVNSSYHYKQESFPPNAAVPLSSAAQVYGRASASRDDQDSTECAPQLDEFAENYDHEHHPHKVHAMLICS